MRILVERVNDVVVKVAQTAVAVKVHLVGEDGDVRVLVRVLQIKCPIVYGMDEHRTQLLSSKDITIL